MYVIKKKTAISDSLFFIVVETRLARLYGKSKLFLFKHQCFCWLIANFRWTEVLDRTRINV